MHTYMLDHMKRAQKIWDFLFGVMLIGGAPIVAYCFAAFILSFTFRSAIGLALASQVILACSVGAFLAACFWRMKHRNLPKSLFVAELLTAIFAGALFMLAFIAAGYAAYRAD